MKAGWQHGESTVDLAHPPQGTWFRRKAEGFELGSTTRSGVAFFLVPFLTVWSAFTLGAFYGLQIHQHKFDLTLTLVGIPFLAFALFFWCLTMSTIWGKVIISVEGDEGRLFTGAGPMARTRKFKWSTIREIREGSAISPHQNRYPRVVLRGETRISFGAGVRKDRLNFMRDALYVMLAERQGHAAESG